MLLLCCTWRGKSGLSCREAPLDMIPVQYKYILEQLPRHAGCMCCTGFTAKFIIVPCRYKVLQEVMERLLRLTSQTCSG